MHQIEHFFNCPHCGESISMVLDLSISEQAYTEDCEVCCAPIEISYHADNGDNGELVSFSAET